jgi:hypothetical protein
MLHIRRGAETIRRRAFGRRVDRPWHHADLSAWHAEHHDPAGQVWAVRPPCGYGEWALYPPGTARDDNGFTVGPAADRHPATELFGGDTDGLELADVEHWMRPWVAAVADGPVVEMTEGWSLPYGRGRGWMEYVIYARVGRPVLTGGQAPLASREVSSRG